MTAQNLFAWSVQIAVLALAAAAGARAVRIPKTRLFYWQIVLLACLALPVLRPWKREAASGNVSVSPVTTMGQRGAVHRTVGFAEMVLPVIAAGIVLRGVWLAVGFWRLRRYRLRSRPLGSRGGAALLVSDCVFSPVTFGALRPVVLLPARFPELEQHIQEAILCHELLHVRRRDWLFTVAEETVRALWWFHPAIWWVLAQIQLAREQAVDRDVIETTSSREVYLDALLAMAGSTHRLDLAPAPLFLRKRHLKKRMVSILKEVRMSKTRSISLLSAALCLLAGGCWLVTGLFPLRGAPQIPDAMPAAVSAPLTGATLKNISINGLSDPVRDELLSRLPVRSGEALTLDSIERTRETVAHFDPHLRMTFDIPLKDVRDVRANASERQAWLYIAPAHEAPSLRVLDPAGPTLRVGGNAQESKSLLKVRPAYPLEAKQAHVQGVVELGVRIDKQGSVANIDVISGPAALVPAALEAVRHWVWEPTLFNGSPVDVVTQVDVNFTLAR